MDLSGSSQDTSTSVRFQLVSDIHLEFPGCIFKLPPIPVNAPILCLLGDIGYPSEETYRQYLLDQADRFEHVLVVAGNHEYYKQESVQHADRLIDQICAERDNLHYLNKRSVRIGDVLFLGCTLWSYIPPDSMLKVRAMCNDYRAIRVDGPPPPADGSVLSAVGALGSSVSRFLGLAAEERGGGASASGPDPTAGEEVRHNLSPEETNAWHDQHVEWLVGEIDRVKQANDAAAAQGGADRVKVVVLTHHAPSRFGCIRPDNVLDEICYDDLEWMMEDPVVVWAFGHTHWSSDNVINSTRVVSNQCGYITMNPDGKGSNHFDPGLVIDVDETLKLIESPPSSAWEEVDKPSHCALLG